MEKGAYGDKERRDTWRGGLKHKTEVKSPRMDTKPTRNYLKKINTAIKYIKTEKKDGTKGELWRKRV